MVKKKATLSSSIFILDILLILFSFLSVHYFWRGSLFFESKVYAQLLIIFSTIWLITSNFSGKYRSTPPRTFIDGVFMVGKSAASAVSLLAFIIVILDLQFFPRPQVIGTCLLVFSLELVFLFFLWSIQHGGSFTGKRRWFPKPSRHRLSYLRMGANFVLISMIFLGMNLIFKRTLILTFEYQNALLMIWAVWLWAAVSSRKFEKRKLEKFLYFVAPSFKAFFMMVAATAALVYFLDLSYLSWAQLFSTLFLYMVVVIGVNYFYYRKDLKRYLSKDIQTIEMAQAIFGKEDLPSPALPAAGQPEQWGIHAFETSLKDFFLKEPPALFEFVRSNIDRELIATSGAKFFDTFSVFDIEATKTRSLGMLLNLHQVNDFKRLNYYFLQVRRAIVPGGYFFGCVKMKLLRKRDYLKKFQPPIGLLIFWMSRFFYNIFPYIPGLKQIYFSLTQGRKRVLSKAEVLGRLHFCGFEVIALKLVGTRMFFIVKKASPPSLDKNPSYGPIIKLRRIGMHGKIIQIYKFRTMYPYAEYLQQYVYDQHKLENGGKFKNDFRVHPLGRRMRALHLDELPQLVNLFRGELGLVGVRALSEHYFHLYPKELQDRRIKSKPGCIPPYYADMPKSFKAILASENRYLAQKEKHPFLTDVRYFFRAIKNLFWEAVVFIGNKSGPARRHKK